MTEKRFNPPPPAEPIVLNAEGRYLQGPTKGKAEWLLEMGARERRMPRIFPLRANQLVAVIDRGGPFDAALWIQDEIDYQACRKAHGPAPSPVRWFELPNDWLMHCPREPEEPTVDSCSNGRAGENPLGSIPR